MNLKIFKMIDENANVSDFTKSDNDYWIDQWKKRNIGWHKTEMHP